MVSTQTRRQNVVSISTGNHRERVVEQRNRLTEENLHLVAPIARRIYKNLPPCFELDDLISAGNIGLMEAAQSFRPSQGTKFSTWAHDWIHGAIIKSIRRRKYTDATLPALETVDLEAENMRTEHPEDEIVVCIDRGRKSRQARQAVRTLSPLQQSILDAHYSAAAPSLAAVAQQLGVPEWRVYREHAEALTALKEALAA